MLFLASSASSYVTGQVLAGGRRLDRLVAKRISTMPWAFAVAVERQIAKSNPHAQVDVANLFRLYTGESPHWRRSDAAAERINRKIDRFVVEAANGEEITDGIKLDWSAIPPVPQGVEGLRSYSLGAARVGLAVLSTATSVTTICAPASTAEFGAPFPRAWRAAHLAAQAGEQVAPLGYDEIWIFNGRFCYSRPFCDVVEAAGALRSSATSRARAAPPSSPPTIRSTTPSHRRAAGPRPRLRPPPPAKPSTSTGSARLPGDLVNFYTSAQVEGHPARRRAMTGEFVAFLQLLLRRVRRGVGRCRPVRPLPRPVRPGARWRWHAGGQAAQGRSSFVLRFHPHLRYKHESWRREFDFDALRAAWN
jgi:hypothetical protein